MCYDFSPARHGAAGYQMTIENKNRRTEYELTQDEYDQVVGYCNVNRKAVTFIPAVFYSVRTNNCSHFSKDFFLPTVFNHALKIKNKVGKVFAVIGALFFDLATLWIRLLTVLPSVIANRVKKEHPLHAYLKEKGEQDLSESVRVTLLQKGFGSQRREVHFHDFPAPFFYGYIETFGKI